MFRLSHYMKQLFDPTPVRKRKDEIRPVVIWNLTRRCNLKCRHCYAIAADREFPGELTTVEANQVLDDLAAFKIPALILSGGEPLTRSDTLSIAQRSKNYGIYTALSSNGTPIVDELADKVAEVGFDYVGISLDGVGKTNDWFRGKDGAFDAALAGIRACKKRGIKVGLRFTLTSDNASELSDLLTLARNEGVEKFYLSHLVYAGRGNKNRGEDSNWTITRTAVDMLIDHAWMALKQGDPLEIVTGNNDADAVSFLLWASGVAPPERVAHVRTHLEAWGGNSSGLGVANIDSQGVVHPDTYWSDYAIDNVRNRPFSKIWDDMSDPMLAALRSRPRPLKGRCGACTFQSVCGGNTRIRALQLTGDPWASDPACYLDDAVIGLTTQRIRTDRPAVTPFRGKSHDPAHRFG